MKFKVITPSAAGHDVNTLETTELLQDWVAGIDFSGLAKVNVAVEDEVCTSLDAFWTQVNDLIAQHEAGTFPRDTIEVRMLRPMAGG